MISDLLLSIWAFYSYVQLNCEAKKNKKNET